MKPNKRAFTLMELLVVVLIIGILAAVAVPQYQLAVDKTRSVEAVTQGRAIIQALKRCVLATGNLCTTIDEMDIDLPKLTWTYSNGAFSTSVPRTAINIWVIRNYFSQRDLTLWCVADKTNARANRLCAALGKYHHEVNGRNSYLMERTDYK